MIHIYDLSMIHMLWKLFLYDPLLVALYWIENFDSPAAAALRPKSNIKAFYILKQSSDLKYTIQKVHCLLKDNFAHKSLI